MESTDWSGWVQKKAFKTLTKASWKKRFLKFDAQAFQLIWADSDKSLEKPKGLFELNANEIEYKACEDHKKPFEVKVTSNKQTLYFCMESADQLNNLMARIDAARRMKVASVEDNGNKFKTAEQVAEQGNGISPGEPGPKVLSWGVGILLGIGKDGINGMSIPQRIPVFRQSPAASAISAGPEHACALTDANEVHLWGSNEFYQLSQPQDCSASPVPVQIAPFLKRRVLSVACGGSHSLGVIAPEAGGTVGQLWAWGTGTVGQLGLGSSKQILDKPEMITLPNGPDGKPSMVSHVYAGLVSSACLSASGECYVWGDASAGRLGLPGITDVSMPGSDLPTFVNGTLVWAPTQLKFDPSALGLPANSPCTPVHVSLGGSFSLFMLWTGGPGCILLGSGALGVDITRDSYGYPPREDREIQQMIDDEIKGVRRNPVPMPFDAFGTRPVVLDAFAGARHAAVVVSDPSRNPAPRLYTAGKGWLGHRESPDTVLLTKPSVSSQFQAVGGALSEESIVQAGCGHSHTLARTADGRLFAWGRGDSGELGHGNLSDRSMPAVCRPVEMHIWTNVSAGSYYSIGVVEPSFGSTNKGPTNPEEFKKKWQGVADAQEAAKEAAKPAATTTKAKATTAAAASTGGSAKNSQAAKEKAAQDKARADFDSGELPPNWGWDQTDEGEVYYIMPDGETTWDDPRDDWDTFWKHYLE